MSQRKRAARQAKRHRDQVVRLIEEATGTNPDARCPSCRTLWRNNGDGTMSLATAQGSCPECEQHGWSDLVPDAEPFDVALARSYAESLIAEGERLERERLVFMDWTRERGLGPENRERGAFAECPDCDGTGRGWIDGVGAADCGTCEATGKLHGGWPGPLAREWGTVRCGACEGEGRVTLSEDKEVAQHEGRPVYLPKGLILDCERCQGVGRIKHPKREAAAANGGAWMIRAGRLLLDTLDGGCPWAPSAAAQPSECDACNGRGRAVIMSPDGSNAEGDCLGCRGTGHNLSGTLPPVEVSPQRRRWLSDAYTHSAGPESLDTRQGQALVALESESHDWDLFVSVGGRRCELTRVVPRGQHRAEIEPATWVPRGSQQAHVLRLPGPVTRDGEQPVLVTARRLAPRWRRGELRHSEQRRERERRQAIGWAREVRADGSVVVDLDL